MKKYSFLLITLFSASLFAQQENDSFRSSFGLGVTFGKDFAYSFNEELYIYPLTFGNIYFPIDLTPKFRFEPEFGYYRSKSTDGYFESIRSTFRFGIGLFSIQRNKKSLIQIGARVGIIKNNSSEKYPNGSDYDYDRSKTDCYFGFATGGEYLFSKHVSLGGEAQLNYINLGNYYEYVETSTYLIATRTLIILRFYY
jgi:hypothetical protein